MTDSGIAKRLAKVAADLGPIQKRMVDAGFGGKFQAFAVDDVYAHLGPLFAKHGIAVVPQLQHVEYVTGTSKKGAVYTDARVTVSYKFVAPDGTSETMTFAGEGRDYQDKSTNKAVQQAFKYGLVQMFQIATGEVDPDAVKHDDEPAAPAPAPTKGKKAEKPAESPFVIEAKTKAYEYAQKDMDKAKELYASAVTQFGEPKTERDVSRIVDWFGANAATLLVTELAAETVMEDGAA